MKIGKRLILFRWSKSFDFYKAVFDGWSKRTLYKIGFLQIDIFE